MRKIFQRYVSLIHQQTREGFINFIFFFFIFSLRKREKKPVMVKLCLLITITVMVHWLVYFNCDRVCFEIWSKFLCLKCTKRNSKQNRSWNFQVDWSEAEKQGGPSKYYFQFHWPLLIVYLQKWSQFFYVESPEKRNRNTGPITERSHHIMLSSNIRPLASSKNPHF